MLIYCRINSYRLRHYFIVCILLLYFSFILISVQNRNTELNVHLVTEENPSVTLKSDNVVIGVLLLVCDRTSITRTLDQLLQYRPKPKKFPILVSQDCGSRGKRIQRILRKRYRHKIAAYLTHPNYELVRSKVAVKGDFNMLGYYHIAAHYGWALNYTFYKLGYDNLIVVEDDLDIAPDFFEYFEATLPLLNEDPTLWCISAYNDIGKSNLVDLSAPDALQRTDFFPGLGWMLTKDLWNELSVKWPEGFWDDWMRQSEQRKGRACIHPEIPRTKTYGRIGTSNGQFFDKFLKPIELNDRFVRFRKINLSYLKKAAFDKSFLDQVNSASTVLKSNLTEIFNYNITENSSGGPSRYRITYSNQDEFHFYANKFGIMDDLKDGVPRSGYKGIVSFMFRGKRIYMTPSADETN